MKSKLPAAWLGGKDNHVHYPGVEECFYTLCFGKERCKLF